MSNFPAYKTKTFSPTQKFFVLDPNTGSPAFVQGSDLIAQITPSSNYVYAEATRTTAQATDYPVGALIETAGATSAGDNFAAVYLVVESDAGDFPMDNGNELLVIKGDELLRQQLATEAAGEGSDLVVKADTGETVTAALNQRTIYVGSVADLESLLSPIAGQSAELTDDGVAGPFVFRSGDQSANVSSDPLQGVWVAPSSDPTGALGAWMRRYDSLTRAGGINIKWLTATGDGTTDDTPAIKATLALAHTRKAAVYAPEGSYRTTELIEVEDEGVYKIFGDGKDKTSIRPDVANGLAFQIKTYYTRSLIIEDLSINSLSSTAASGILVYEGTSWGAAVDLRNVNILNFTDVTLELRESFNSSFTQCELRNPSGGSERFGTLLKLNYVTTFGGVHSFNNCVLHWGKIGLQNLAATALSFKNCTFENLDLFHNIEQLPGLSMFEEFDSCWFEQIDKGIINAQIDEGTLAPILPVTNKAPLGRISFSKNMRSAGVVSPFLDSAVEPFYIDYFTPVDGINYTGSQEAKTLTESMNNGEDPSDPAIRAITDFVGIGDLTTATFSSARDGQFLVSLKATALNGSIMSAAFIAPMNSIPFQVSGTIYDPDSVGDSYKLRVLWADPSQLSIQAAASGLTDLESNIMFLPFAP